ncbi:MAG: A/G-specific adenine glycosylase [Flavobacteriia bacterium]|nr:A/G-specific adenine glycosylase [Flavobacteriia bacterium]
MSFNYLILIWFDANKRNLPWRDQTDPYKIWISEIILQQTRVVQGTKYYLNFLRSFPTIRHLAEADEQQVLKLWQGLGYYSRARNLHQSAKYIVEKLNGRFPDHYNDLLKLKGVGEYTAAAIASIAFHEAVPAIDGNAFRVLSRNFDIELDISDSKTKKYFQQLGTEIIDQKRPGDFNQAVMELGATVCLPKNPKCEICPLNESCAALAKNKTDQLPVKSNKLKIKSRQLNFFEITDGENFLMVKRTADDIWKNLYSFPLIEDQIKNQNPFGISDEPIHSGNTIHLLTHQRLTIDFWRLELDETEFGKLSKKIGAAVYSSEELKSLPVPKPIENYLKSKI